jgi:ATP-dependent RNA helicase SUPV3L1/SUV3
VAVIDEIQMMKDYQRGWAWTRALLGVPAEEIHVCGEVNAFFLRKFFPRKFFPEIFSPKIGENSGRNCEP